MPGCPDIVFPKYKAVIFIHGCFWHHHDCKLGKLPSTNVAFWKEKLEKNEKRDRRNIVELKDMGWKVKIIWLCQLKDRKNLHSADSIIEIIKWIKNQ